MEPLDVTPNDPVFFLHHANVDRVWATWQLTHPGSDNYLPQGGQPGCPYPLADDGGPDDWMYPYCLDRYEGTAVHHRLTPAAHIETETLGYQYASYYAVPSVD